MAEWKLPVIPKSPPCGVADARRCLFPSQSVKRPTRNFEKPQKLFKTASKDYLLLIESLNRAYWTPLLIPLSPSPIPRPGLLDSAHWFLGFIKKCWSLLYRPTPHLPTSHPANREQKTANSDKLTRNYKVKYENHYAVFWVICTILFFKNKFNSFIYFSALDRCNKVPISLF